MRKSTNRCVAPCLLVDGQDEFTCEVDPGYFTDASVCSGEQGIWCADAPSGGGLRRLSHEIAPSPLPSPSVSESPSPLPSPEASPSLTSQSIVSVGSDSYPSEVSWSLSCTSDEGPTYLSGGSSYYETHSAPLGSDCSLSLVDSFGDGWQGAEWAAPGWVDETFSISSGSSFQASFTIGGGPSPSPSPSPSANDPSDSDSSTGGRRRLSEEASTSPIVTIDAMERNRMFFVAPGVHLTLKRLHLIRGKALSNACAAGVSGVSCADEFNGNNGGCIFSFGATTLHGCVLENCSASGNGGSSYNSSTLPNAAPRALFAPCEY